jgi:hypothetical protein
MDEVELLARLMQNVAVAYSDARFRGAKLDIRRPDHARYVAQEVQRMRQELPAQSQ